jgi:hypothetical protein
MKSISKVARQMFLLALFALLAAPFSAELRAQDRNPGPESATRDNDFESRSNTLRNMTEKPVEKAKPVVKRDPQEVMQEARDAYRFLQVDNKALKQTLATATPFEPASVSEFLNDIRKRAEYLDADLSLPELDKKAEHIKISPATTAEEFKASVATLSDLIRSFVTNPCFREPALLVDEHTMKARLDLEDMLALTQQLQKDGEKFAKSPAKP